MNQRVLVVDDEEGYRTNLHQCFEAEGYEVRTAATSDEALTLADQFHPDVVVADWMLKERLTGLDLTTAIRRRVPGVETVLITGYPSPELEAAARAADVFDSIKKPFDLDDLLGVVRYAMQARRDEKE